MKSKLTALIFIISSYSYAQSPCTYDTLSRNISLFHCDTLSIKLDIARFHSKLSKFKLIKTDDFIRHKERLLIWIPSTDQNELIPIERNNKLVSAINVNGPLTLLGQNVEGELFIIYSTSNLLEVIDTFKKFTNAINKIDLINHGSSSGYFVHGIDRAIKVGNPSTQTPKTLTLILNKRVVKRINSD